MAFDGTDWGYGLPSNEPYYPEPYVKPWHPLFKGAVLLVLFSASTAVVIKTAEITTRVVGEIVDVAAEKLDTLNSPTIRP